MEYTKKWCDDVPDRIIAKRIAKQKQREKAKLVWQSIQEQLHNGLPKDLKEHANDLYLWQISITHPIVLSSVRKFCMAQRKKKNWFRRLWLHQFSTNITPENVHELNNYILPYVDCLLEKGYRVYFNHDSKITEEAKLIINWLEN